MSFSPKQARAFLEQVAAHRQAVFGGADLETAPNLQAGLVTFRAAFTRKTARGSEGFGFRRVVDAVALIPDSLGLSLAIDGLIIELETGDQFTITGIDPGAIPGERKVTLRLLIK
jgi:hypothetical protein